MNTKELRVGNIVFVNGRVEEVETVGESGINYYALYDGICSTHESKDIEGIPLTEDWALNLGFNVKQIFSGTFFCLKKVYLEFMNFSDESMSGFYYFNGNDDDVKIQYVHQLQNLYFALTGEELIIKD